MRKSRHLWPKPLIAARQSPPLSEQEAAQLLPQKVVFRVQGIHCASCVVRIERKLKQLENVQAVQVDITTGKAEILCTKVLSVEQLHQAVQTDGYTILAWEEPNGTTGKIAQENTARDYLEIGFIALLFVGLFLAISHVSFLPTGVGISENMGYGLIFVIGLIASVSSCAAATGALLIGMTTAYNQQRIIGTFNKLKPTLLFQFGRILSYTFFGAVIGALGTLFTLSAQLSGVITLLAALVMLLLGVQLLKLFPWMRRFQPRMPKFLAHKIYDASGRPSRFSFFPLGAATFFLPCGFTQALQLYVLSRGSILVGGLTMLVFSLGTSPALLSFSAISNLITGRIQGYVIKVAGVLVLLIGLLNFNSGLLLSGVSLPSFLPISPSSAVQSLKEAPIVNGKQQIFMKVVGREYTPSVFTIVVGVPVAWQVDGSQAEGCAQVLTAPDLGIEVALPAQGQKTIIFVPHTPGTISFRCPLAMTTAGAKFIVLPGKPSHD